MNVIDKLRAERDDALTAIEALQEAEDFDPGAKEYVEARSHAESLDSKIKAIVDFQKARQAADSIDALSTRAVRTASESQTTESPGSVFVRSEAYRSWSGRGRTDIVDVDLGPINRRAALTTTGFAGQPQRFDVSEPKGSFPLSQLVNNIPVSGNSVEYVKYEFTSAAAVVAEGTAKPESTLERTIVPKSLSTVAHWVEATRQLLEDETAVRSMIDEELRYGVRLKFEELIATAILGATVPTATGADIVQAIRMGVAALPDGYVANAVLLNPVDLAEADISVMLNAGIGPDGTARFWGLVPVTSNLVTAGTAFVGDFNRAVTFWSRSQAQVYITDSDISGAGATAASNFKANILTLLGEGRGLADVVRPNGLVEVSVAAP